VRTPKGGMLDLAVKPGDLIYEGDMMGSILNPFGKTVTRIRSPATGIVIGITTAPLSVPGTAIAHIAKLRKSLAMVERSLSRKKARRNRRKKTRRRKPGIKSRRVKA
jgi:predicted deacylase